MGQSNNMSGTYGRQSNNDYADKNDVMLQKTVANIKLIKESNDFQRELDKMSGSNSKNEVMRSSTAI